MDIMLLTYMHYYAGAYETVSGCPKYFVCCSTSELLQTSASLMVFILAMVMYPDVQKRAQAEIDSVIGLDQLPTFEDRPSLPYMEALFREILRWHPIVPLGDLRYQMVCSSLLKMTL